MSFVTKGSGLRYKVLAPIPPIVAPLRYLIP
jgi:hypothetical protein